MKIYLVRATSDADRDDDGNPLWWSNEMGWVSDVENAFVFSSTAGRLPVGGAWVEFVNGDLPKDDPEFMDKMLAAFPDAEVGQDNDGQLVIYTNLRLTADGSVVSFESES